MSALPWRAAMVVRRASQSQQATAIADIPADTQ